MIQNFTSERNEKKAFDKFMALSLHFPGCAEENHKLIA
jgi:hypothetical protein